ncbi:MAG: phosphohydrolase, partial [Bacteroidetes bacterium]|nr:phosphohydrolase [Bacteroidota bacterium]
SKKEIIELNLELPYRDMIPVTDIEKLVCLADKFYSKSANSLKIEKSYEAIRMNLMKYGNDHLEKFNDLLKYFNMF